MNDVSGWWLIKQSLVEAYRFILKQVISIRTQPQLQCFTDSVPQWSTAHSLRCICSLLLGSTLRCPSSLFCSCPLCALESPDCEMFGFLTRMGKDVGPGTRDVWLIHVSLTICCSKPWQHTPISVISRLQSIPTAKSERWGIQLAGPRSLQN